jgi:hypothetical protein
MPSEKHLEMIVGIISRLAGNSFQMKSWNVALASAAIGFAAAKGAHTHAALLAVVPSAAFWFLDGYYLTLERRYRALYNEANSGAVAPYDLNAGQPTFGEWLDVTVRRIAVIGLHFPMLAVTLAAGLVRFGG